MQLDLFHKSPEEEPERIKPQGDGNSSLKKRRHRRAKKGPVRSDYLFDISSCAVDDETVLCAKKKLDDNISKLHKQIDEMIEIEHELNDGSE